MNRKPAFVLFDLGNVLVYIHPEAFLQTLGIDTPENRQYYRPRVTEIVRRYERGEDTTEQYLDRLDGLFNHGKGESGNRPDEVGRRHFTRAEFTQAMLKVIGKPVEGMEDLVRRTAAAVPVGLLSNTNPLHYDFCRSTLAVIQFIPHHFLSFRIRSLKPERAIFEHVRSELALDTADVLYVDDLAENIEAARQVGFGSYLFAGRLELEAKLRAIGLV